MTGQITGKPGRIVSCDWGTSSFRMRLVELDAGDILGEFSSGDGISVLDRTRESLGIPSQDRAKYLCRFLDDRLQGLSSAAKTSVEGLPVVVSGMASSTLGIRSLPYAPVPFRLDGSDTVWARIDGSLSHRGSLFLISGVSGAEDMLRGEEVELMGIFGQISSSGKYPRDAVFVLPGTHSKHVRVSEGRITGIGTYITGEMFALLRGHSVLRNSLRDGLDFEAGRAAFMEGVRASGQTPLLRALFGIRARHVLDGADPAMNLHYLSGLLIGQELRSLPVGDVPAYLCIGAALEGPYRAAMEDLYDGRPYAFVSSMTMSRACTIAHRQLFMTFFSS